MLKFLNVRQTPEEGGGRRYCIHLALVRPPAPSRTCPCLSSCWSAVLFLPSRWTHIFVLPAVVFRPSSGYSAALPTCSQRTVFGVCVCVCCLTLSHQYISISLLLSSLSSHRWLSSPSHPAASPAAVHFFFFFLLALPVAVVFCRRVASDPPSRQASYDVRFSVSILSVTPLLTPIAFSSASPDFVFSPSSLCFVSMLSFTSVLHLLFISFLHFTLISFILLCSSPKWWLESWGLHTVKYAWHSMRVKLSPFHQRTNQQHGGLQRSSSNYLCILNCFIPVTSHHMMCGIMTKSYFNLAGIRIPHHSKIQLLTLFKIHN